MSRRNPNEKTIAISVTIPKYLVDTFDYLSTTEKGFQSRSGLIVKAMQQYVNNSKIIKKASSETRGKNG